MSKLDVDILLKSFGADTIHSMPYDTLLYLQKSGKICIFEADTVDAMSKAVSQMTRSGVNKYGGKHINIDIEKARRDLTKLAQRKIVDKNGVSRIVYVKVVDIPEKGKHVEVDFMRGDTVSFSKNNKKLMGTIQNLKFNEKTDVKGTAIVDVDGEKHSVSLAKVSMVAKTTKLAPLNKNVGEETQEITIKKLARGIKAKDVKKELITAGFEPVAVEKFVTSANSQVKKMKHNMQQMKYLAKKKRDTQISDKMIGDEMFWKLEREVKQLEGNYNRMAEQLGLPAVHWHSEIK